MEKENEAFDKMFDLYNELKDEWEKKFIQMLKTEKNSPIKNKLIISIIAVINHFIKILENLRREDVTKSNDFTFNKILQIKIENETVYIKIFNYNFEYGNEYVGLNHDFFVLPQTEKSFLSIFNTFFYHKPFLLYNNQIYFKKEILKITSNILGRHISHYTSNNNLDLPGLNNIIYGNMKNGHIICIQNIEFIDRNGEKFNFNNKKFNLFMTYNIETIHLYNKDYELPLCIKNNFRLLSINYIDYNFYMKILFKLYSINKAEAIVSKINYIINGFLCKGNLLNKKNLKEKIFHYLFTKLKEEILLKINDINSKNVNSIIKNCLILYIQPFISTNQSYKNEIMTLINITLFDYEEKEKMSKNEKHKKTNDKAKMDNIEDKINIVDSTFNEEFKLFSFEKNNFISKIQSFYDNLKNNNFFIFLGPTLTGKTNSLIILRDISLKLNKIDNNLYPIFSYVKIYQN